MKLPSFSTTLVLTLALSAIALPPVALAQSIVSLQSNLAKKETALTTLDSRIASYGQRQLDAEEKLQAALQVLAEATNELETARQNTHPEAANQQALATKKVDLARNALESRQSRLNSAREKYTSLLVEKQSTEAEIAAIVALITKKQQSAVKPAKVATSAPAPAAVPVVAKQAAPKIAEPEVSQPIIPEPSAETPVAPTEVEDEPEAEPTPRQLYAQQQMAALNERVKGADKDGWRQYESLNLKINNEELIEFEYLGNHQYYAEIQLKKGKNKIKVRARTFTVDVPDSESENTFVAIYDTRDRNKAEFSIFNKTLTE